MRFRDATFNDLKAIVDIYNSTIPSRMVTADTEAVTVADRIDWFHKHSPEKRPLLVVEDEQQKVIAWLAFHSFYGRKAYDTTAEVSIYIAESHRGKGLGREILKFAEVKAKELGVRTLLGYIFAHNEPSLKLFRSFGFEQWGYLPNVALLDNVERSLCILGKVIR